MKDQRGHSPPLAVAGGDKSPPLTRKVYVAGWSSCRKDTCPVKKEGMGDFHVSYQQCSLGNIPNSSETPLPLL